MFWKKTKRFPIEIRDVYDLIDLMEKGIIDESEARALLDLPEFEDEDGNLYNNLLYNNLFPLSHKKEDKEKEEIKRKK